MIRFKDANGVPREHDVAFEDIERWLAGYTQNGKYPVTELQVEEIE